MPYPKRLIEVDLPIKRVSEHARREKSIRHGHISTLHIWWARRPLAACRAVICAALWPDPADPECPDSFRETARSWMRKWASQYTKLLGAESMSRFLDFQKYPEKLNDNIRLRQALLDFIADFANWDNSKVKEYLETSRALTQAAHEALGGAPGTRPLIVDPFAGGGSIPLEALRVGADAFASDLNPIPVLLNKITLEYIPRGGPNLKSEIVRLGNLVKNTAAKEIATFYPKDKDGSTPLVYLWSRTVKCEGPKCGYSIPLIRTLKLADDCFLSLEENKKTKSFDIRILKRPTQHPTVSSGSATCPRKECGYTTKAKAVKKQLAEKLGGANDAQLLAVIVERNGSRRFREPSQDDYKPIRQSAEFVSRHDAFFPNDKINPIRPHKNTRGLSAVTRIGIVEFRDLYTSRQLACLKAFVDAIATTPSLQKESSRLTSIMGIALGRLLHQNCSVSRWQNNRSTVAGAFGKQALQITWDFAETCPLSSGPGSWDGSIEWIIRFIDSNDDFPGAAVVQQSKAKGVPLPNDSAPAVITDPPYFAAIPYSDLSQFFYVWLRKIFKDSYPDLFSSSQIDQAEEAIVTNANVGPGGEIKDHAFFEREMTLSLSRAREILTPDGIAVVVFADTKTESWEAILGAILAAAWTVTGSWPIDTELQGRTQAQQSASLQSSIHIVCRPRENSDGTIRVDQTGDWRDVLQELPRRIHEWMPRLAKEGIVGADAIFACLGPALEIFSRYSKVEKASGDVVTLKEYLEHVWAAVAKEALAMIFTGADASGFEEDARLTAMWLWTVNAGKNGLADSSESLEPDEEDDETAGKTPTGFVLEYDAARKIAQGLGAHLDRLSNLLETKGEVARLLPVAERAKYLFGKTEEIATPRRKAKVVQLTLGSILNEAEKETNTSKDKGTPKPGNTVLDRVHQSMILFGAGRGEALKRFLVDEGAGQDQRFWRLAQALAALYPANTDERRWVEGVMARKKGLGF